MTRAVRANSPAWVRMYREDALRAQGGRCLYCRTELTAADVTADHRLAQANGGQDRQDNIDAVCRLCNRTKGKLSAAQFKKLVKSQEPERFHVELIRAVRRVNLAADRACTRILRSAGMAA